MFYAQTQFLFLSETFNSKSFVEWMRVVRNIVHNSTIDSASSYVGAIGLINELSKGHSDIYRFLLNHSLKSGFAAEQMKEEIVKSSLVLANNENRDAIFQTEDTPFCKGKIDFALYCCDFNIKDKPDVKRFDSKRLFKVLSVFKKHLSNDDITNDFRRAFLTIRNNDFYNYWTTSWLYAVNSPKRCLIANISELKDYFALRGKNNENIGNNNWEYLKELILQLTKKEIDTIIDEYSKSVEFEKLPNWKKRIIKEKGLLDYSEQHFIAIKEDNRCCWLIPQSRVANSQEGRNKCKIIK